MLALYGIVGLLSLLFLGVAFFNVFSTLQDHNDLPLATFKCVQAVALILLAFMCSALTLAFGQIAR